MFFSSIREQRTLPRDELAFITHFSTAGVGDRLLYLQETSNM